MRAKLRQVGNSVGLTIPASELKAVEAQVGDMVELEIKQVIRPSRSTWNDPAQWQGADKEPLLLDDVAEPEFDQEDWQW
jgi:antitoxin component of MazEF toxin-antitoxin module